MSVWPGSDTLHPQEWTWRRVSFTLVILLLHPSITTASVIYTFTVFTGHSFTGGTDANVYVKIDGTLGSSGVLWLNPTAGQMETGASDAFSISTDYGAIYRVAIGHDNTGTGPTWNFKKLFIDDHVRDQSLHLYCDCWVRDGIVEPSKVFPENIDECASNPCQNSATCQDLLQDFTCACATGWTGDRCEQDVNECDGDPCVNGGVCENTVPGYNCHCPPLYTGDNCHLDVDECSPVNPCEHGATCLNEMPGYTCHCAQGFTGTHCQNDVDECSLNVCRHGLCNNIMGSYRCDCHAGWEGINCHIDTNECTFNSTCENGAECINNNGSYSCVCLPGFTGTRCENETSSTTTTTTTEEGVNDSTNEVDLQSFEANQGPVIPDMITLSDPCVNGAPFVAVDNVLPTTTTWSPVSNTTGPHTDPAGTAFISMVIPSAASSGLVVLVIIVVIIILYRLKRNASARKVEPKAEYGPLAFV